MKSFLTLPFRVLIIVAVLAAISITPVLAQSTTPIPPQSIAACDGQTLAGQPLDTQNQFVAAYGADASNAWAQQHSSAVLAAGVCAPSAPPVAAAPPPEQVVVIRDNRSDNNNGNSNDNNDDNGNDNHDSNDNDDRRPRVSLDLSRDDVNRDEHFQIRVEGHREGDGHLSRIWWWATDTDDQSLRDEHVHECDDSDTCRHDWEESSNDTGRTIRIHARARDRDGRDSDEVTRDIRVR